MRQLLFLFFIIIVGCAPNNLATVREVDLPTLVPFPTSEVDMQEALRAAMGFLGAWQAQDFDSMYSLLSFASQETVAPNAFRELYEGVQNTMTFEGFEFTPQAMSRPGPRTTQLVYDLTFQTRILGDIFDPSRNMIVILDPQNGQWRIAWSIGDIFAEFATGGRLEFQTNAPSRANIYDRNGTIVADMQGRMVEVFVIQEDVPDWDICRSSLSDIINIPTEIIDVIFANARPDWRMRVGLIDEPTYRSELSRLETDCNVIPSSSIITRRYLPNGAVMPHVLGFVGFPNEFQMDDVIRAGFDAETIIGQAGVEASWNDTLMGTPGGRLVIFNADGSRARTLAERPPEVAESIWLTIDINFQQFILQTFSTAYGESRVNFDGSPGWGSQSPGAAAVVMNVKTGEILALVSYPTFDANAFTSYPAIGRSIANGIQAQVAEDERRPMLNRATQGMYPAGSIFKAIDSTAVLDTHVYNEDTRYVCVGTWRYENDVRYDWWAPGHGSVTVQSAIKQSCNPFFYQVGFVLNSADPFFLPNYARRMGLGNGTGLEDLTENRGLIPDPDVLQTLYGQQWTYSNAVNLSIGQGEMGVTPLQIARTYGAIANGGDLLRPRLVRERGILNQRTFVAEPDVMSNFGIDDSVMDIVRAGLCDVPSSPSGTAVHIFRNSPLMDTVGVCGKTGTAQTGRENEQPHSWFVAYAPAEDPEIVVVVLVENAGDGSAVAAPIVKQIMEYYFFLME